MTGTNGKPISPFKTWRSALPIEGVVAVIGHRRTGKTRDVWAQAEKLHKSGRRIVAFRFPRSQRDLLPDWVTHVETLKALSKEPPSVIVCDELARSAHARDHATAENREWPRMLAIVAQHHHLMYCIYQSSRQMDVAIAMDVDLIFFKEPSQLHIRFARPELRPEIAEAYELFSQYKANGGKGDQRGMIYVVDFHRGRKGFVRGAGKASFWNDQVSTAYALAEARG